MRIKISKKEAKECRYWLRLLECPDDLESVRQQLLQEATELMLILGAILNKSGP
jgi:four helix bundle protein